MHPFFNFPTAPSSEDRAELEQEEQDERVHAWRVERLQSLGLPRLVAETFADHVDWHVVAGLVGRGCSPYLAVEIVR